MLPDLILTVGSGPSGQFVHSNGRWSAAGQWRCAQPFNLAGDITSKYGSQVVKKHIAGLTRQLQTHLRQAERNQKFERIADKAMSGPYSKAIVLHCVLQGGGPSLRIALGWIDTPAHR